MPSGKPIDWPVYDDLFRQHLSSMTLTDFTAQFLPHISTKAVGARARTLGIKHKQYKPTAEHRAKISITERRIETPELIEAIRSMRQTHSRRQICIELSLDDTTLWRIINRHNIELDDTGRARAVAASTAAAIGREPWNKGGVLSEETKQKISSATSGELNSQYGRGMTEDEKEKWRESFNNNGRHKLQEWIRSDAGKAVQAKSLATTTSIEFREAASKRTIELIRSGKIRVGVGYKQGYHDSPKAGKVYYRSSYELRYYTILDADDNVFFYEVEPVVIEYAFAGSTHRYIPDIMVYHSDGHIRLVEIKPNNLAGSEKNLAKIAAGYSYCGDEIEFAVVTEDDL